MPREFSQRLKPPCARQQFSRIFFLQRLLRTWGCVQQQTQNQGGVTAAGQDGGCGTQERCTEAVCGSCLARSVDMQRNVHRSVGRGLWPYDQTFKSNLNKKGH